MLLESEESPKARVGCREPADYSGEWNSSTMRSPYLDQCAQITDIFLPLFFTAEERGINFQCMSGVDFQKYFQHMYNFLHVIISPAISARE